MSSPAGQLHCAHRVHRRWRVSGGKVQGHADPQAAAHAQTHELRRRRLTHSAAGRHPGREAGNLARDNTRWTAPGYSAAGLQELTKEVSRLHQQHGLRGLRAHPARSGDNTLEPRTEVSECRVGVGMGGDGWGPPAVERLQDTCKIGGDRAGWDKGRLLV